ncbi:MAG: FAD-dependent oxidoreductase [Clostridia bacterium]|nr:FAD-dependent oxidoreductase [Clostridia bacterium]
MTDLIIIGGGMAGLTAAVYSLRAGKSVLVIEKSAFGGQITSSPRVDNYPGLPAISGNALADALLGQALDLSCEVELEEVSAVHPVENGFTVCAGSNEFKARAIIVATGARPRPLGLPGEEKLIGRGISYCALCDGAFHKGQNVAVVGGGNTAAQAAVFLSDICSHVTVLQDLDHFTCDQRDYEAMRSRENISFQTSTRISALEGDDHLTGLKLLAADGASSELPVQGLFVSIGRIPDTEAFADLLSMDKSGFLLTDDGLGAGMNGIWAAGDCRRKAVRQLTTAAADGTIAAVNACRFLDEGK